MAWRNQSQVPQCTDKGRLLPTSGGAITNFSDKLPPPQSKLAQAITKDTYDFGFISLPNDYEEEQLELALERQVTSFLLELSTGFSYLGRQRQIVIAGKTRKLDMLFFHIPLNCYIVVELKVKRPGSRTLSHSCGILDYFSYICPYNIQQSIVDIFT